MATQTITIGSPSTAVVPSQGSPGPNRYLFVAWDITNTQINSELLPAGQGNTYLRYMRIDSSGSSSAGNSRFQLDFGPSPTAGYSQRMDLSAQFEGNWKITFGGQQFNAADFVADDADNYIWTLDEATLISTFRNATVAAARAGASATLILDDGGITLVDVPIEVQAGSPSTDFTLLAVSRDVPVEAVAGTPFARVRIRGRRVTNRSVSLELQAGSPSAPISVEEDIVTRRDVNANWLAGVPTINVAVEVPPPEDIDVSFAAYSGSPRGVSVAESVEVITGIEEVAQLPTVSIPAFASNKLQLLISQWENAPNLQALIGMFLAYFDQEVTDSINYLHRSLDVDHAEGVWLDRLASRLNIVRPTVRASTYSATFGFDDAGAQFNQQRIRDVADREPLLPIDDILFRKLIKSKIVASYNQPSIRALRQAVDYFDVNAQIRDNYDMTVQVVSPLYVQIQIAHDAFALPKPAGVDFQIDSSERFGFDEAGAGFNQGVIR